MVVVVAGTLTGTLPRTQAQQSSRSPCSALPPRGRASLHRTGIIRGRRGSGEDNPQVTQRQGTSWRRLDTKEKTQSAATRREFPSTPCEDAKLYLG